MQKLQMSGKLSGSVCLHSNYSTEVTPYQMQAGKLNSNEPALSAARGKGNDSSD